MKIEIEGNEGRKKEYANLQEYKRMLFFAHNALIFVGIILTTAWVLKITKMNLYDLLVIYPLYIFASILLKRAYWKLDKQMIDLVAEAI